MRREGWTAQGEKKKPYKPKPYEQMQYPGQRVIDGKVVPWRCIVDPKRKLCHYTVMDEYSRNFTLGAHEKQSVSSSTDFLCQVVAHFVRKGFTAACILAYNDFEIISRFFNSKGDLEICFETWAKCWHTIQACAALYALVQLGRQRATILVSRVHFAGRRPGRYSLLSLFNMLDKPAKVN